MKGKMSKNAPTTPGGATGASLDNLSKFCRLSQNTKLDFHRNNIWINKSVRTTIRASHHFKCQRRDCKRDIVAEGTQWVKGPTLMRCLWRLSWCNNFKVVSTPIKILQSVRSLIFSQLSKLLFVSCIWRGVRSDAQLMPTETRFQKCSQSGKNGSKHPI